MAQPAAGAGASPTVNINTQVWQGLLTAMFNLRYYQALQDHFSKRDNAIRIAVGITSPATVTSFAALEAFPGFKSSILVITAVFGVAATVLAVVAAVLGYQSKLTEFGVQYANWCQVKDQFYDLWLQSGAGTPVTLDQLKAAATAAAGASQKELDIPKIRKLMVQCQDEVTKEMYPNPH